MYNHHNVDLKMEFFSLKKFIFLMLPIVKKKNVDAYDMS